VEHDNSRKKADTEVQEWHPISPEWKVLADPMQQLDGWVRLCSNTHDGRFWLARWSDGKWEAKIEEQAGVENNASLPAHAPQAVAELQKKLSNLVAEFLAMENERKKTRMRLVSVEELAAKHRAQAEEKLRAQEANAMRLQKEKQELVKTLKIQYGISFTALSLAAVLAIYTITSLVKPKESEPVANKAPMIPATAQAVETSRSQKEKPQIPAGVWYEEHAKPEHAAGNVSNDVEQQGADYTVQWYGVTKEDAKERGIVFKHGEVLFTKEKDTVHHGGVSVSPKSTITVSPTPNEGTVLIRIEKRGEVSFHEIDANGQAVVIKELGRRK
jgi:hypothetical protein